MKYVAKVINCPLIVFFYLNMYRIWYQPLKSEFYSLCISTRIYAHFRHRSYFLAEKKCFYDSWIKVRTSKIKCIPSEKNMGLMQKFSCIHEEFPLQHTWLRSDIRNSRLAPGSPISKYVRTNRRSAEFPSNPWTQTIKCNPPGEKMRYSSLMWK